MVKEKVRVSPLTFLFSIVLEAPGPFSGSENAKPTSTRRKASRMTSSL
jgi:hypothetical protein